MSEFPVKLIVGGGVLFMVGLLIIGLFADKAGEENAKEAREARQTQMQMFNEAVQTAREMQQLNQRRMELEIAAMEGNFDPAMEEQMMMRERQLMMQTAGVEGFGH